MYTFCCKKHKSLLFQERFKSEAVETDSYFLMVLRYIHQNPIKAKIVSDVAAYQWSSYSEYVESAKIVDKVYALNMFSDNPNEAIGRFGQFLRETNSDVCLEIPEVKVNVSDDALRQRVRQQFGIDAIKICNEMREKQDHILRVLKGIDGTNIRQIARITGLDTGLESLKQNPCPCVLFLCFIGHLRLIGGTVSLVMAKK